MKSTSHWRTTFAVLVAIGALMLFGSVPAFAECDTTGTPKPIETKQTAGGDSVTGGNFTCDSQNPTEWHFVINQVTSQTDCPASISLTWQGTCPVSSVSLDKFTGGTCHYRFLAEGANTACLTDTLLSATTSIYPNWSDSGSCGNGQFNVSHAPCGEPPPPPPTTGSITACKFYDFNTNGTQDASGEVNLSGWSMTITPLDGATQSDHSTPASATLLTDSTGCVTWYTLSPSQNPYTVTEGTPTQTNWVASTPIAKTALVNDPALEFGNYCKVPSGGLTLGFWSNKNGQALFTASDLAFLGSLNLRNAGGSDVNPADYTAFRTWLLGANATNMAYMLSAQLAAMELNVRHGGVDGGAFALCANQTINDLMTTANTSLGSYGLTTAGNPNRPTQEALKNCLDTLNNGGPVVPTTPCTYSFAQ